MPTIIPKSRPLIKGRGVGNELPMYHVGRGVNPLLGGCLSHAALKQSPVWSNAGRAPGGPSWTLKIRTSADFHIKASCRHVTSARLKGGQVAGRQLLWLADDCWERCHWLMFVTWPAAPAAEQSAWGSARCGSAEIRVPLVEKCPHYNNNLGYVICKMTQ